MGKIQEATIDPVQKLTTVLACKVAGLDRDRFNDAVGGGFFSCAPATVAGRARLFGPADLLALRLYRELLDDACSKVRAGRVACAVGECAREHPGADVIAYVEFFGASGLAVPADELPPEAEWRTALFYGSNIRTVTKFNVGKQRDLLAHYVAEALSIHGAED